MFVAASASTSDLSTCSRSLAAVQHTPSISTSHTHESALQCQFNAQTQPLIHAANTKHIQAKLGSLHVFYYGQNESTRDYLLNIRSVKKVYVINLLKNTHLSERHTYLPERESSSLYIDISN